jgi:hypothetical protein
MSIFSQIHAFYSLSQYDKNLIPVIILVMIPVKLLFYRNVPNNTLFRRQRNHEFPELPHSSDYFSDFVMSS